MSLRLTGWRKLILSNLPTLSRCTSRYRGWLWVVWRASLDRKAGRRRVQAVVMTGPVCPGSVPVKWRWEMGSAEHSAGISGGDDRGDDCCHLMFMLNVQLPYTMCYLGLYVLSPDSYFELLFPPYHSLETNPFIWRPPAGTVSQTAYYYCLRSLKALEVLVLVCYWPLLSFIHTRWLFSFNCKYACQQVGSTLTLSHLNLHTFSRVLCLGLSFIKCRHCLYACHFSLCESGHVSNFIVIIL